MADDNFDGTPAADAAPVQVVMEAKQMLQAALQAEVDTIERYIERRRQEEEAREVSLAAEFEGIIPDETRHRDELRQMPARWP